MHTQFAHTDRTLHGSLIIRFLGKITRISRIFDKNRNEIFLYDDKNIVHRLEIDTNEEPTKKLKPSNRMRDEMSSSF